MANYSGILLITGGCGFIGTNLVRKLADGMDVRVLDNLSRGKADVLKDCAVDLHKGDIRDLVAVRKAMEGVNTVVHLAAYGSVVESVSNPLENFENNVTGTLNVLLAAQEMEVKRMIFASTGGALVGEAKPPVNEFSLPKPISPYGASKLCGEAYCHAFATAHGLETVALRFANIYGPYSAHKKGAITAFMKAIMTNQPMVIYGNGSATRDFLYVEDLCQGILRALKEEIMPGDVFHLASGLETSISDLARMVAEIAGVPNHPVKHLPPRQAEVSRNFAQYDKALAVLGFEPRWSLREGLEATWQWMLAQGEKAFRIEISDS